MIRDHCVEASVDFVVQRVQPACHLLGSKYLSPVKKAIRVNYRMRPTLVLKALHNFQAVRLQVGRECQRPVLDDNAGQHTPNIRKREQGFRKRV